MNQSLPYTWIRDGQKKNEVSRDDTSNKRNKCEVSRDGTSNKRNKCEVSRGDSSDTKKNHPLMGIGLGNFNKISLKYSSGSWKVECTCHVFRRDGSCMDSKFFGLLAGDIYPPNYCIMNEQGKRWKEVANELRQVFVKCHLHWNSQKLFNASVSLPPEIDPMYKVPIESRIDKKNSD